MSESYLGEIRMFAGNYAPQGWALCNGQLLNISEYEALYALLSTTYGGDGKTTFALPDLRGRIAIHPSTSYPLASKNGTETVTLVSNQLPQHTHIANATSTLETGHTPANSIWGKNLMMAYSTGATTNMSGQLLAPVGSGQPHDNMMPTTTISFIISIYGYYPPQQ
ncbi:tail fiber protein [Brevibacillus ruminantium]|uniref:Tail fiber protein n=1 Tax=Brevibacillus ruminantium TaxID=2950604 RepID=A0ABY4WD12_9BACL|nr:tail fiber protein [Brevibacillus ruminantium]USG65061.1 tail fiber protein [Brevibacillus ruminantium]